jgi:hypothetical protein
MAIFLWRGNDTGRAGASKSHSATIPESVLSPRQQLVLDATNPNKAALRKETSPKIAKSRFAIKM